MPAEQFSLELRLVETWRAFDLRLISVSALYVVWGALSSPENLVRQYLEAKKETNLLDRRRRFSDVEQERMAELEFHAEQAIRYRDFARSEGGQPILRDALIAGCAAFENALKDVAHAMCFSAQHRFIDDRLWKKAWREVIRAWKSTEGDGSRMANFFDVQIVAKNPHPSSWPFRRSSETSIDGRVLSSRDDWLIVAEAFKLRNAVVHEGAKPPEQICLGSETFDPGVQAHLTSLTVKHAHNVFRSVLNPINPEQF